MAFNPSHSRALRPNWQRLRTRCAPFLRGPRLRNTPQTAPRHLSTDHCQNRPRTPQHPPHWNQLSRFLKRTSRPHIMAFPPTLLQPRPHLQPSRRGNRRGRPSPPNRNQLHQILPLGNRPPTPPPLASRPRKPHATRPRSVVRNREVPRSPPSRSIDTLRPDAQSLHDADLQLDSRYGSANRWGEGTVRELEVAGFGYEVAGWGYCSGWARGCGERHNLFGAVGGW
jgi:hypothetical protein